MLISQPAQAIEREYPGFTGNGYVRLTRDTSMMVEIPVQVTRSGVYAVDVRYANGSGPINTYSKAVVHTLMANGRGAGALVMPQRDSGMWPDWGCSTQRQVELGPGTHTLMVVYNSWDENMDGKVNTALLDHVRLTLLSADPAK